MGKKIRPKGLRYPPEAAQNLESENVGGVLETQIELDDDLLKAQERAATCTNMGKGECSYVLSGEGCLTCRNYSA